MRIAVAFPGCHRRGGVERIVYECSQFLAARGHEVAVFAEDYEGEPASGLSHRHVPRGRWPWFARGYGYFHKCSQLIGQEPFDVLNTHGCVCPTGGVHWVQSIQQAWLETSRRHRPRFSWARLRQRLNPLHPILLNLEKKHFRERAYRKVIATTPEIRDDLNRLYDVPEEDVVVIPNGFSPTEFNPARRTALRSAMRETLGLHPDHVALLFVANELQRKGYDTLLRALQILKHPNLRVLVVGRVAQAEVMERARAFDVADQVIACGSTANVGSFHAAADLFVLPTQYEAFCLAILEALGSGLPVITTTVPGAKNAIQPGRNGELVAPEQPEELAEAIVATLKDSRLYFMASHAAPSVADYQWPVILARYEQVLFKSTQ